MIDVATLAKVSTSVGQIGLSEATLQTLRREWPDLHFTLCSDDDVPARLTPALEGVGFNLHLVSNAQHCVAFTTQIEDATGVVLAAVEAND